MARDIGLVVYSNHNPHGALRKLMRDNIRRNDDPNHVLTRFHAQPFGFMNITVEVCEIKRETLVRTQYDLEHCGGTAR